VGEAEYGAGGAAMLATGSWTIAAAANSRPANPVGNFRQLSIIQRRKVSKSDF
jgi:hypothetical protein